MAFDPEEEIEKIEEMKKGLREHFDYAVRRDAASRDRDHRNAAANSALAYAELVKVQAELARLGRSKSKMPVL